MYCLLLVLVAPMTAQEAPTPEPVGLRPDAPTYALHGPYWVGTMSFPAQTPSHRTQVTVWYPALNPTGAEEAGIDSFVVITKGHAIVDAAPDRSSGPYSLIVYAHGMNGIRMDSAYLCEHLASYGFVVMAINYAESFEVRPDIAAYQTLYSRPQDVSWQIDQAAMLTASGEKLENLIDLERVAVIGWSLGGYTALAAAGARLDLNWYSQYIGEPVICILAAELGGGDMCKGIIDHQQALADLAGLAAVPEGLWPSWRSRNVVAVVGLAPAAAMFGPDGLKEVTVPTLLMLGSGDQFVSPEYEVYPVYDYVSSTEKAFVVLENAAHHIFYSDCQAAPWALSYDMFWLCSDPVWDMDRGHDLINHFTTAFLLDVLKGDAEAHAALAPDAVSFVGIEYQAQGF